jgi:hypothetical protein
MKRSIYARCWRGLTMMASLMTAPTAKNRIRFRAGTDWGTLYHTADGAFTVPRSEVKRLVDAGLIDNMGFEL